MDQHLKSRILDDMATRVRVLREAKGWSQAALGERVDASESAISKIEAGLKTPSLNLLIDIADELGTSADRLLAKPERRGRKPKTEAA